MQVRVGQLAESLRTLGGDGEADVLALADRLDTLSRFPPAESASRALARALIEGLAGRHLSRETSERLASHLFTAMNGGYLRRPHLERVTRDIEKELAAAGAPVAVAAAAREAGIRVAREPRNPRSDWW
jgi:hypothetical protein